LKNLRNKTHGDEFSELSIFRQNDEFRKDAVDRITKKVIYPTTAEDRAFGCLF
jgi:hypothetical protein